MPSWRRVNRRDRRLSVAVLLGDRLAVSASFLDSCGLTREELDDRFVEFIDDSAERQNVEDTLTIVEQVDDFFTAAYQHGLIAVDDEVRRRDVFSELVLQVGEDLTDLLEANTRIEQVLYDLEFEEVSVGVLAA